MPSGSLKLLRDMKFGNFVKKSKLFKFYYWYFFQSYNLYALGNNFKWPEIFFLKSEYAFLQIFVLEHSFSAEK